MVYASIYSKDSKPRPGLSVDWQDRMPSRQLQICLPRMAYDPPRNTEEPESQLLHPHVKPRERKRDDLQGLNEIVGDAGDAPQCCIRSKGPA